MPFDDLVEPNNTKRGKKYDSHKSEEDTMDFGKEEQKHNSNPLSGVNSPRGSVSSHSNFNYEESSSSSDGDFEDCEGGPSPLLK